MRPTEDGCLRKLCDRVRRRQISGEWAKGLEAPCPGEGDRKPGLSLYPVENDLGCQRSGVPGLIDEAGERPDLTALDREVEAELPPFGQVVVGQGGHGADLGHDTLPGQGNATATSLVRSTFV